MTQVRLQRIFRPYTEWEDAQNGMWRSTNGNERDRYRQLAADLMKLPEAFTAAMRRVLEEWPNCCEVNLSWRGYNRQAWLGHAGCCLQTGSPEDVTRQAWHTLTTPEQDAANQAADAVIEEWERRMSGGTV